MARGTVTVASQRCKGCGLCIAACPQHVLAFGDGLNAQGYHPVELLDSLHGCTGCALCALVCPDVVFTVYREPLPVRAAAARPGAPSEQRAAGIAHAGIA